MKSRFSLSSELPIALQGHAIACQVWAGVLSSPGLKITAFDERLLITYCLVIEEENKLREIYPSLEEQAIQQDTQLQRQIRKSRSLLDKRISQKRKLALDLAKSLFLDPPVFHP
jgi:hypothetical protein